MPCIKPGKFIFRGWRGFSDQCVAQNSFSAIICVICGRDPVGAVKMAPASMGSTTGRDIALRCPKWEAEHPPDAPAVRLYQRGISNHVWTLEEIAGLLP
jgi:hypothetical protein